MITAEEALEYVAAGELSYCEGLGVLDEFDEHAMRIAGVTALLGEVISRVNLELAQRYLRMRQMECGESGEDDNAGRDYGAGRVTH